MAKQKSKKNYIKCSVKEFKFSNGGQKLSVSINVEQLAAIANEKGYANIEIYSNMDGADRFGNTHHICENTWQKENGGGGSAKSKSTKAFEPTDEEDDLPW